MKGYLMKLQSKVLSLLSVFAITLFAFDHAAGNVVGYVNVPIYAGDNLIANQLDPSGLGNAPLDVVFPTTNPAIPDGTTFTEWDPVGHAYLPVSTYNSLTG